MLFEEQHTHTHTHKEIELQNTMAHRGNSRKFNMTEMDRLLEERGEGKGWQ